MHIVGCGMSPAPQRWLFSSASPGTGRFTLLRRGWSLGIGPPPAPSRTPCSRTLDGNSSAGWKGWSAFLTRGCRDASQHALVAAGKMLVSGKFRCAGAEGEFLGSKGTTSIATPEPLPCGQVWHHEFWEAKHSCPPGCSPQKGYRDGLNGPQIHLPKENPKLRLDFAMT